jgi:uncharacterized damage-inducible protein DinB
MNDDFVSLFAYNRWADRRVLGACRKLTAEQYVAEPVPGWSSVRSSIVHIAVVTEGWLSGFEGKSDRGVLTEADLPTVDDAERLLDRGNQIFFNNLVPKLTPLWLATSQTIRSRFGCDDAPPWIVLRHIVNHSTYHRGQVASKLKRLGVEQPATDFVDWAFEQIRQKA